MLTLGESRYMYILIDELLAAKGKDQEHENQIIEELTELLISVRVEKILSEFKEVADKRKE